MGVRDDSKRRGRLAALALPTGTRADWQQWDWFLTNVVKKLVKQLRDRNWPLRAATRADSEIFIAELLSHQEIDQFPR
jgi:hypothetical protein